MTVIGAVPYDDAMMNAERDAKAPFDHAPESKAVEAIRSIASEIDAIAGAAQSGSGHATDDARA